MALTTPTLLLSPQHPPPPPQPVFSITPDATHHRVSPLLIAMVVLLSSSLLVAVSYFLYSALSPSPPRSRRPYPRLHDQSMGVFNYHLGWYVATVGLQRSVIESIAVCKYNKGDGLVHGTGCAVCLVEFEDGESIRMLPMCRHAFHVPCIDTWLASRTTCPICRAPVLPAGLPDEGAHSIEIGDGLGPGLSLAVSVQDEGGRVERGVGRTIRRAASMENLGGKPSPSSCSSASSSSSCGSLAERSLSCSDNLFSSGHNESR